MPNGPEAAQESARQKMYANHKLRKSAADNPFAALAHGIGEAGRAAGGVKTARQYMTRKQQHAADQDIAKAASRSHAGVGGNQRLAAHAARIVGKHTTEGQKKRLYGGLNKENARFLKHTGHGTVFASPASSSKKAAGLHKRMNAR